MLTELLHQAVSLLLNPVILLLLMMAVIAILEMGIALGERLGGMQEMAKSKSFQSVEKIAKKRIERADLITRIAPILGLMGTLIPLGPGLAELSVGSFAGLAASISIAFDTTVLGLFSGMICFIIGRKRRRWYDQLLVQIEGK